MNTQIRRLVSEDTEIHRFSKSNSEFAVVISCTIDTLVQTLILDTVSDVNVSVSSTLTEHPIVDGSMVADHMFKEPAQMTISGSFSLSGANAQTLIVDSSGATLANIEGLFERIKDEGIQCEVVKLSTHSDSIRFLRRQNMVLLNISWTEKINSLGFSFTFKQAMTATVQEFDVDTDDLFLPNVTDPKTLSFTDSLLDWDMIDSALLDTLMLHSLITDDFASYMSSMTATSLVALGVGLAAAYVAIAVFCVSNPVGWIIGGVIAVAVFVYGLVKLIANAIEEQKYRIDQFKYYKNDNKRKKETQRFSNFVGEIHKQMNQLNNAIQVYQVSSSEPQECLITIGHNNYIFTFTRTNTNNLYSLEVRDLDNVLRATMSDISAGAMYDFSQCTSNNYLFVADEIGSYVYLVSPSEERTDLTEFFVVSTTVNPDDFNKIITEIITNALTY